MTHESIGERKVKIWVHDVDAETLLIPRFQRSYVWNSDKTVKFLKALLNVKRPVGVFMVLGVNKETKKFPMRNVKGYFVKSTQRAQENLLDGQQRLTTLWRALKDLHEDYTYYIKYEQDGEEAIFKTVVSISKKSREYKNNKKEDTLHLWEHSNKYVPYHHLCEVDGESMDKIDEWIGDRDDDNRSLRTFIKKLRKSLSERVIPYLYIDDEIDPEEAINIFIETNESSVKISPIDVIYALVDIEQINDHNAVRLRERVSQIGNSTLRLISSDRERVDLVLKVACVIQGIKPTNTYKGISVDRLLADFDKIENGFGWMAERISAIKIWDDLKLPSTVPLRILPVLAEATPGAGQKRSEANDLITKYLWYSFLSDRYDTQANDKLLIDYNDIKKALKGNNIKHAKLDCFDEAYVQLPTLNTIIKQKWPGFSRRRRLARAILAVCYQNGANDIATHIQLDHNNVGGLVYHHVFPRSCLPSGLDNREIDIALNCILINQYTSEAWGKQSIVDYINALLADESTNLSVDEIKKRLDSHLLPSQIIMDAAKHKGSDINEVYKSFIKERANMVLKKIDELLGLK